MTDPVAVVLVVDVDTLLVVAVVEEGSRACRGRSAICNGKVSGGRENIGDVANVDGFQRVAITVLYIRICEKRQNEGKLTQ